MSSVTIALLAPGLEPCGGRGGPLERASARVCREAGATVTIHTLFGSLDDRRVEVIACSRQWFCSLGGRAARG